MESLDGVAGRIADNLDDHEAWMVLADGLLDRSDERGRWINRTYDDDARTIDGRLTLEARLHQGGPRGFRWPGARLSRRFGFVVRIHARWDDDTLRHLHALDDHHDGLLWRSLSLSGVPVDALAELAMAPFATRLRTLTLASNDLGDTGLRALAAGRFPSLTKLDVQNNGCTAAGIADLVSAPFVGQLHTLRIRNNPLGPTGGEVLATLNAPALTTLDLTRTELTDAGLQALGRGPLATSVCALALGQNELSGTHLTAFTGARTVDLTNNQPLSVDAIAEAAGRWTSLRLDGCAIDDAALRTLFASSRLESLSVGRNPDISFEGLHAVDPLDSLQALDLSDCGVTTRGWQTLARLPMPRLRQLQLDRCAIRGFGDTPRSAFPTLAALHLAANPLRGEAEALAGVELPSLRGLGVHGCGVDDLVLEAWRRAPWFARLEDLDVGGQAFDLAALGAARNLVRLHVSRCDLTQTLDALWSLPDLEILDGSYNRLSSEAVFAGAGHPNLRQLNLASNELGDAAVAKLVAVASRFPRLQHLNLRANPVSPSTRSELEQALSPVLVNLR